MIHHRVAALFGLGASILVTASTLIAQDTTIVLRAARMFDGRDVRTPGVVIVRGAAIIAAGSEASVPPGAQVIDLGDATLSPGFIDAHTHLSGMYNADYRQGLIDSITKSIPEQALLAAANLKKTIMAGVTTVRDLGSSDFIDVGLRNAAAAGAIPGPRMLVAGHAIGATGG